MTPDIIPKILITAVPLLLAIILHEVAHGWVAEKLGDPTARMMGRLTLNPISHIDILGTIVLPGILLLTDSPFLFGWAKPVPVNFANLRGGRTDMALVALSGPMTNLILAVISSIIFHLAIPGATGSARFFGAISPGIVEAVLTMTAVSVRFNIVLMVINLLPVPPLDGGRILVGVAPMPIAVAVSRVEPYGMLVVLLLIVTGFWSYIVTPFVSLFWRLLM